MTRKRALGRGLDALIGAGAKRRDDLNLSGVGVISEGASIEEHLQAPEAGEDARLENLPLGQLSRGRYQPRREITAEALEELADSIRAQGVMQPIVVRPTGEHRYEIIAGERRWRAAQLAELDVIPAVIRQVSDSTALALALIENIQRENLNVVEEASALKQLGEEFRLTQQEIADAVGKSRTQVANLLRLLALDPDVLRLLERGDLDMGHARALLSLDAAEQRKLAHEIVDHDLTVRATETLVKRRHGPGKPTTTAPSDNRSQDVVRLESRLSDQLGAPVSIQQGQKGKGKLTIRYTSLEELDGILAHIH